ncbi:MAG TPA: acyltransferase [Candidatus Olsenella excrementavium]|uniref:Acyltransferase n=1 Tax=Candidatus Olsenella excrementavium TaxID=2838709 RepID=A0A9D1ZBT8_9ACTN|nr:acyltransferase [Candidatus Olsenella excrementavium]
MDGLRGVACLAVLLLHAAMMLELWGPDGAYPLIPGTPAVVIFFVLSGVVLSIMPLARLRARGTYDWLGYYPRRVVRLGVPLVAAVALGIAAGYVAWRMGSTGRSATAVEFAGTPQQVVHDVLMQFDVLFFVSDDTQNLFGDPLVRVNSPVWSMSWELWFSLTLPLVVACLARIRRDGIAAVGILAGIFVSHWCGYFPLRLCLTFWLGVLLAKHLSELSAQRPPVFHEIVALAVLLGAVELAQAAQAGLFGPLDALALAALQTLLNAACAGLVALAMTDGIVRRALSTRPARFLGTVSFSLYLTHALVIGGLEVVLPAIGITDGWVQACVAVLACLACAAAFWRLVERPAIELSRRVGNALGDAA